MPAPMPPVFPYVVLAAEPAAASGTATMAADGPIVMDLRAPGPAIGEAHLVYRPGDPHGVLRHLPGMRAGETRSVPPFPD